MGVLSALLAFLLLLVGEYRDVPKHLRNMWGHPTLPLVFTCVAVAFITHSWCDLMRENRALQQLMQASAYSDEEYFRELQGALSRLNLADVVLVSRLRDAPVIPAGKGTPAYEVSMKLHLNASSADWRERDPVGSKRYPFPGRLSSIYNSTPEDDDLGKAAEWDAVFRISIVMMLASQRLTRISQIEFYESVTVDERDADVYFVKFDPRAFTGEPGSRELCERYARANLNIVRDTLTGKRWRVVDVPR
jgi:hypothetical protein